VRVERLRKLGSVPLVDGVIAWCGFVGAWLLVAGAIYQAALELQEQDVERERIEEVTSHVPAPDRLSAWWWLLPPVRYLLAQRRQQRWRRDMTAALTHEDLEALINLINKARGWLLVGAGGLLLAIKETWELHEHYECPQYVFWGLAVVAGLTAALNTVLSVRRSRHILDTP
jgi:hypothetical protein